MLRNLLVRFFCLAGLTAPAASDTYFPTDAWPASRANPLDQWAFLEGWYGGQLAAMEEDTPWDADVPTELTLRLLFLPTFSPASALRLSQNALSFRFTKLDGAGGCVARTAMPYLSAMSVSSVR